MRDARWGEPKILGETDEDMAFGAGYVAAEDRLAIMELLRALGRAEAFEMLGTVPAWFADLEMARMYGYTEDEWQAQVDRLPEVYGAAGRDVKRMVEEYAEGMNQYLIEAARGEVPLPPALADTASACRRRGRRATSSPRSRPCARCSAPAAARSSTTRRCSPA